ncbi:SAM-dependent methyltransferase [Xylaria venustula]|nr:SAM-dependent methyltransferase [Xylaria venustula]
MTPNFTPWHPTLPLSLAPKIASYSLPGPGHAEVEEPQAAHRIRLVNAWGRISPGSRVLELGCGQGTATAVLAEAVGETGHVDALDPAPPDYGAPVTLGDAQQHLSAGPVGSRITWHRATLQQFLESAAAGTRPLWDVAVLAHSIWYLESEEHLEAILAMLHGRVRRVCVAEYALHASEKEAFPHVLAVLARGTLEANKDASTENVRSPLSPSIILKKACRAGFKCIKSETLVPEPGLLDGSWEVGTVVSEHFMREADKVLYGNMRAMVASARDATVAAVNALHGAKVRTMDVWVATLIPDTLLGEDQCEDD